VPFPSVFSDDHIRIDPAYIYPSYFIEISAKDNSFTDFLWLFLENSKKMEEYETLGMYKVMYNLYVMN
jgi:hypothetical protein